MKKSTSNALLGFLTGAAAGAVIGILYAPEKGSKTRKNIRRKSKKIASDLTESVNEQVDNIKEQLNNFVDDLKSKISNLEKEVKNKATEEKNKAAEKVENKARQAKKSS